METFHSVPNLPSTSSSSSSSSAKCPHCSTIFRSKKSLLVHDSKREPMTKYTVCNLCGKYVCHAGRLERHIADIHDDDDQKYFADMVYTTCHLCGEEQPGIVELYQHYKNHYDEARYGDFNEDKYKCKYCGEVLITREAYWKHARKHVRFSLFPCELCSIKLETLELHGHHMKLLHNIVEPEAAAFECSRCSTLFPSMVSLSIHKGRRLPRDQGTCNECGKIFCTRKFLDRHLRQVHNVKKKTYGRFFCQQCNEYFKRRTSFDNHLNNHNAPLLSCDECPATFRQRDTLTRHKALHTPPEQWRYRCDLCNGETFPNSDRFTAHMRQDINKHKVKCHLCGLEFLGIPALSRHIRKKHPINTWYP